MIDINEFTITAIFLSIVAPIFCYICCIAYFKERFKFNIKLPNEFSLFKLVCGSTWRNRLTKQQRAVAIKLIPLLPITNYFVGIDIFNPLMTSVIRFTFYKCRTEFSDIPEGPKLFIIVWEDGRLCMYYRDSMYGNTHYSDSYSKFFKLEDFQIELNKVLQIDSEKHINLITKPETGLDFQI